MGLVKSFIGIYRHKRSNVPGKVPTKEQLKPGEIAINTVDHSAYSVDDDGEIFKLNNSEFTSAKISDPGEIL